MLRRGVLGAHEREGRTKKGWPFEEEGRQDNSCQKTGKGHRWLHMISGMFQGTKRRVPLPLGFGDVSMVYSSFMLLIS